ncbi:MAG: (E)-4-hydroxy-3-methylbut-2-enyl-diphosphate synthase [Chlamydiales bacterium]|nr:(E)-4-hydroxy-3-methylbut-2-enyl-diphosphate synthase [Chlamydiales bacterium]
MIRYCESIFQTIRRKTREVKIGSIGVGGNNPLRIQSMTTSNTRDVEATIEQIIRLSDEGCEIVRVTVQGMKEAQACEEIKDGLLKRGYTVPLVADIHFFPPAALYVADFVDKVRINPGNYVDKRASFKQIEYDDRSYAQEIEKIEEKFTPLVEKCKRLQIAMRIGTNHGSLSDRVMNRYGDTAQGMVESALEFARICRKKDYHDFLFSMKSSNPRVMVLAYRLLTAQMYALSWDYPLHLGVTEAGEGEDGRIKSAMGIGSLLLDGIGDTLRVSLTEDPWNEIDPCRRLIAFSKEQEGKGVKPFEEFHRPIDAIGKREVRFPKTIPLHRDGSVLAPVTKEAFEDIDFYQKIGCDLKRPTLSSLDGIILNETTDQIPFQELTDMGIGIFSRGGVLKGSISIRPLKSLLFENLFSPSLPKDGQLAVQIRDETEQEWELLERVQPDLIFLSPSQSPLLCDGLGDGIAINGPYEIQEVRKLGFNILQAARMRTFKTDFISCPSCGRTLFDLQEVSKRIRSRCAHLPGVKVAIMGCIVNGPGEMADADFGYVGSKPGKVDLYVGKERIEKEIDFADADDRLVDLIKRSGRWIDPV